MKTTNILTQHLGFKYKSDGYFMVCDFGNFSLDAVQDVNRRFELVVHFDGVYTTARTLSEVHFEFPTDYDSVIDCAARLAFQLDLMAGGEFIPKFTTPWLKEGRAFIDEIPKLKHYRELFRLRKNKS